MYFQTSPTFTTNPNFELPVAIFGLPRRGPNFEPPAGLKLLEGKILSYDLARQIKRLLTLLAALARFTRWEMGLIRRWLHAVRATRSTPSFERVGRTCSLAAGYRVRGPPRAVSWG